MRQQNKKAKETQEERLDFLVRYLKSERQDCGEIPLPKDYGEKRNLLRALMNVRAPGPADGEFLEVQDRFLREERKDRGITDPRELPVIRDEFSCSWEEADRIALWKGDITELAADGIVNAANSQMLGCFVPCHGCIDNAIHSAAGIQLREECFQMMKRQGHEEPTGGAKLTKACNLPAKYVLHTVGPIIRGRLTKKDEALLASCYRSCLNLAAEYKMESLAFCCISTGEFHFPAERAAEIAVSEVRAFARENREVKKIIFNVFREEDYEIYRKLFTMPGQTAAFSL